MKLSEIAKCLNLICESEQEILGVSIDSRTTQAQDIFIAFRGKNCDGHEFANHAIQNGAQAILAEKPLENVAVPVLIVEDCSAALTKIAYHYRQSLNLKVLALTGSNGKTTVKEMLGCIFTRRAFISPGNFNNHLGVPMNLMALNSSHQYAIFELGASRVGDIAHTAQLVNADIVLINNIGSAHLGSFGSIEQIALAKGEIYQKLKSSGIAVVNDDDAYAHFWDDILSKHPVIRYSSTHAADVTALDIQYLENDCYQFVLAYAQQKRVITLKVPGRHQIDNALAAASMSLAAGIPLEQIQQGLENFTGVEGRLKFKCGLNSSVIIDDTYNANSASMLAGLKVLSSAKAKKIFVMGDIAELEQYASTEHTQVGQLAKALNIDELLAVGVHSKYAVEAFGENARHFSSQSDLLTYLKKILKKEVTVLVKGSRSAKMENIINQIVLS